MKIAIHTLMWKRPEIFKIFGKHYKKLAERFDLYVAVSGSEGRHSKLLAESFGFRYIEIPNDPLIHKANASLGLCKDADMVICVGSDDLLEGDLIQWYVDGVKEGYDYQYLLDFYFYHIPSKRGLYWGGYDQSRNRGHACGAGRVYSRALMERCNWKLWKDDYATRAELDKWSKLLDTANDHHCGDTLRRCKKRGSYLKELKLYGLDVKTKDNMTPFAQWPNSIFIDSKPLIDKFNLNELAR